VKAREKEEKEKKDTADAKAKAEAEAKAKSASPWACEVCTFDNAAAATVCAMCTSARPAPSEPAAAEKPKTGTGKVCVFALLRFKLSFALTPSLVVLLQADSESKEEKERIRKEKARKQEEHERELKEVRVTATQATLC
jgi:hypothetical protein